MTDASFTRPDSDGGFFEPLCVDSGDSLYWLPQSNSDAIGNGVPSLGIANEVPAGIFVDDNIDVRLVSVSAPGGSGNYSLWSDGFPPTFATSSCDGIGANDLLTLPRGHDHFNMGFAGAPAGDWAVTYEVSGEEPDGTIHSAEITVNFRTQ